ncbi:MAG: DUF2905 domain-containing protein [Bacillota bacterium]
MKALTGFEGTGRVLIIVGVAFLIFGGLLVFADKIPGIGRLPGDMVFRRGNFTFYFPLATSLILSLLLTVVLSLFFRR